MVWTLRGVSKRMLLITLITALAIFLLNLSRIFFNNIIVGYALLTIILIGFFCYLYILKKEAKGKTVVT